MDDRDTAPPDPLVEAEWVGRHLDSITIIDCRFEVPVPDAGARLYAESRIPGARFLSVEDDLSDMTRAPGAGRHPLPTATAFQAAARRVGISDGRPVVAYDQAMTGGAARLWWLLRYFGHESVFVLDGGWAGWTGAVEHAQPGPDPGDGDFHTRHGARATLTADRIGQLLREGGLTLVDARDGARYRGEPVQGPMGNVDPVAGHIPGAVNVPFAEGIARVPDDLVAAERIAVYCGSGVTACVLLLALERAGRSDAALYPGSWSEWCRRDLPVAIGQEKDVTRRDADDRSGDQQRV